MSSFSHLHVHTQFSLLDGAADISDLYKKAVKDKMPAIAITDRDTLAGMVRAHGAAKDLGMPLVVGASSIWSENGRRIVLKPFALIWASMSR